MKRPSADRSLRARLAGPFVRWLVVIGILAGVWTWVHVGKVAPARQQLASLEADWAATRRGVAQRQEAKQARTDLQHVLSLLPSPRDFARLPLAISEMAKRDRVAIPSLSYTLEKSSDGLATKAVLQGAVTGQYQDLRRFIYHLEAADGLLLFIEDLNVGRTAGVKAETSGRQITVTLRVATYIRERTQPGRALRASVE